MISLQLIEKSCFRQNLVFKFIYKRESKSTWKLKCFSDNIEYVIPDKLEYTQLNFFSTTIFFCVGYINLLLSARNSYKQVQFNQCIFISMKFTKHLDSLNNTF